MPELPEVEHARRQFLHVLGEGPILDARASDPIVVPMSHDAWREALVGRRIEGASRAGKNVLVALSGDHAMWFHGRFRMDEWLLYAMDSPFAGGARGFCRGSLYTQDGRLVASVAQEGLIRKRASPR